MSMPFHIGSCYSFIQLNSCMSRLAGVLQDVVVLRRFFGNMGPKIFGCGISLLHIPTFQYSKEVRVKGKDDMTYETSPS